MSSKRQVRRHQCTGKIRYSSVVDAERARYFLRRKENFTDTSFINVYKCKFCGSYHVGHRGR